MAEVLIKVENASKKFCRDLKRGLWYGVKDIGNEILGKSKNHNQLRDKEFWAVKDISFEVKRGECLGLIGRNGAGKSTLLKMLNGLIKPDQGRIEMRGRVGALIELGAGFNPILTGRENIYINGSVLGLNKREIDKKIDSIIEFSEIGEFINTPVRYYSTGMKVRLGFSVAVQMEPEVLLIDEVLAVGDMAFILKCFNKMDALLKNTAIILVSHNIPQIARMSTNILLMNRGECIYNSNNVSEGLKKYYGSFKNEISDFQGSDKVEIKKITLMSNGATAEQGSSFTMNFGDDLRILIELRCKEVISSPSVWLAFYDKEQRVFAEVRNSDSQLKIDAIEGDIVFTAQFPNIPFAQGVYSITIGFFEEKDGVRQTIFRYQSAVHFNVNGAYHGWAPVQLTPEWSLDNSNS